MFRIRYNEFFVVNEIDNCYDGRWPIEGMIVVIEEEEIPITCFMGELLPEKAQIINRYWAKIRLIIEELKIQRKGYLEKIDRFEEIFRMIREIPGNSLETSWEFVEWLMKKIID